MSERWLRASAAVSVMALLIAATSNWLSHDAVQRSGSYELLLRSWLSLEFKLSAELLTARAGVVGHYDGIVQSAAARRRTLSELQALPSFLRGAERSELAQELQAAKRDAMQAEQVLERWKREHSVLRNSLRFLPHLAADVTALEDAGSAQPAWQRSVLGIVQDALLLQHWAEPVIAARLQQGLGRLAYESGLAPAAVRGSLNALLRHGRIVAQRTPVLNELTAQLLQPSAAARARRAGDKFAAALRAESSRVEAGTWRVLLLSLLSAGLIAASIIRRLRRGAAELRVASAELGRAVESLQAEQAKEHQLSELKSRFVAMTSHEFRTPLSVIMSSAELLEAYSDRWPAHKQTEHYSRIRSSALGMTRMLDAILMIGRSDAGALRCDAQHIEIGSFCADVVSYMAQADPECRRIVYHGPQQALTVTADSALLRQVLENLLSNAIKYSPNGSPVLCEVDCCERELQLRDVDQGIGIALQDRARLFETFQRGSNVGGIGGSGLGLAVVDRAVQLHGGSVHVRSDIGLGSEFTVRIPCLAEDLGLEGEAGWIEYS